MKTTQHLLTLSLSVAIACAILEPLSAGSDADEAAALEMSNLIEQLDDDAFAVRQAAGNRLSELGAAAFEPLIGAAGSGSREAMTRAIDILAGHLENDDAPTQIAARRALHRIAAGENIAAMRQAEQALAPAVRPAALEQDALQQQALQQPPFAWPAIRPQFAPLPQFFPPAGFAGGEFRRVVVRNTNGVREIHVEENGKKVDVRQDPAGRITVAVIETVDGDDRTKRFSADSVDQLKEKSPEGFQIYERYAAGADAVDAPQIAGPAAPPAHADHFDRVEQHLDDAIARHEERLQQGGPQAEHFRHTIEMLQRHKEQMREHQQHFEQMRRQLAPPPVAPDSSSAAGR